MKVEMQENEFIKDMEKIITILFGPGVNMLPDHQVSPIAGPGAGPGSITASLGILFWVQSLEGSYSHSYVLWMQVSTLQ